MAKYNVCLETTVSTWIEVEADSEEEALDEVWETERSLGLCFLDHHYPDVDEWEISEENGKPLIIRSED